MSGMIKQDGNIFKLCPGFWRYRIIYTEKYRLCTKEIRNQPEIHGRSDIHEPGVIRFRMGVGIIKCIERFPGNTGYKMPVKKTDGMGRFQCKDGKYQ